MSKPIEVSEVRFERAPDGGTWRILVRAKDRSEYELRLLLEQLPEFRLATDEFYERALAGFPS